MPAARSLAPRLTPLLVILSLVMAMSACTARLVAPYDERLDAMTSSLQKATDAHVTAVMDAARSRDQAQFAYPNFQDGYAKLYLDLRALKVRSASLADNQRTTEQVDLVAQTLELLEIQHLRDTNRQVVASPYMLEDTRDMLNAQYGNILTLELAKKELRGN